MAVVFHVTSSVNRESISTYGLDWRLMSAARGIAGSRRPEAEGIFVCLSTSEVDYFLRMNNTGGAADVWEINGVALDELVERPGQYPYLPRPIPPGDLRLHEEDVAPAPAGMSLGERMRRALR